MELFKNTNFDFLGYKWPFIIASLVLSVAGVGSLLVKGGPHWGIEFKGGMQITAKFAKIRHAAHSMKLKRGHIQMSTHSLRQIVHNYYPIVKQSTTIKKPILIKNELSKICCVLKS